MYEITLKNIELKKKTDELEWHIEKDISWFTPYTMYQDEFQMNTSGEK